MKKFFLDSTGRLLISVLFTVIFGILYNFTGFKTFEILSIVAFIYPSFLIVKGIIYAFIVNPIKKL